MGVTHLESHELPPSNSAQAKGWILYNGRISSSERSVVSAIGVTDGLIRSTGSLEEVRKSLPDGAIERNLRGLRVLPGFIDAHSHPVVNAHARLMLDLSEIESIDQLVTAIAARAEACQDGGLIACNGLDLYRLRDRWPTCQDLDKATSDHRVVIFCVGGHFALCNTSMMRAQGLKSSISQQPKGGYVETDDQGRPTGLFIDGATSMVVPGPNIANNGPNLHLDENTDVLVDALTDLYSSYAAMGITALVDAQVSKRELGVYLAAKRRHSLVLRTICMPLSSQIEALEAVGIAPPWGDQILSLGPIKFYCDGTINGGTVCCSDTRMMTAQLLMAHGIPPTRFWTSTELARNVERVTRSGWPVAIHCHGDLAIEDAVGSIERGRSTSRAIGKSRLEHLSFPTEKHLDRIASVGIFAVMQPSIVRNYGDRLLRAYGQMAAGMQPARDALDRGVRVALSGDNISPYEPLSVIQGAVQRLTAHGEPIGPDQALTLDEAIDGYTIEAARAAGIDDVVGSLEVGKLADFIVLGADPNDVATEDLGKIEIGMTVVGGNVIYMRQQYQHLLP